MKYVRTPNAIGIETVDNTNIKWIDVKDYSIEIIKEGNTIKELCDEFVFKGVDKTPIICDSYNELLYWFNHSKEEQYAIRICYGAIWTEWGLKYVAKLNKNGEFELL